MCGHMYNTERARTCRVHARQRGDRAGKIQSTLRTVTAVRSSGRVDPPAIDACPLAGVTALLGPGEHGHSKNHAI